MLLELGLCTGDGNSCLLNPSLFDWEDGVAAVERVLRTSPDGVVGWFPCALFSFAGEPTGAERFLGAVILLEASISFSSKAKQNLVAQFLR